MTKDAKQAAAIRLPASTQTKLDEILASLQTVCNTKEGQGWIAMVERLEEMRSLPDVSQSTEAIDFLGVMIELAKDSIASSDRAFSALNKFVESERGAEIARKQHAKNVEARSWVCGEWIAKGSDYQGNKSSFARVYATLVKKQFGISVDARQIRERWLKGK